MHAFDINTLICAVSSQAGQPPVVSGVEVYEWHLARLLLSMTSFFHLSSIRTYTCKVYPFRSIQSRTRACMQEHEQMMTH